MRALLSGNEICPESARDARPSDGVFKKTFRPKVALVYPTTIEKDSFFGFLLPALGLERLGAAAADIADVELFDMRFEPEAISRIVAGKFDFVAVSVGTTLYSKKSYAAARDIKYALPRAKVVTGGLHATLCPNEALEYSDFVILGDGEESFKKLVSGEDAARIPGLVYRSAGRAAKNEMAEPPVNMDDLRPPARGLRKPGYDYSAAGLIKMDLLETSRGCAHSCSFCAPASVYPGRYRAHSPEYVFDEVKKLAAAGVKLCMVADENFCGDLDRVEKICNLIIAAGIKIAFFSFFRPFEGRMELKKKMTAAGFVMMSYGAESPTPGQLLRYGKGFTESANFIKRVNAEWLEAGACHVGNSYIFGDPKDSVATIEGLGDFARGLDPTYIEPQYSQPFPGTRYRAELKKAGKLDEKKGWSHFAAGRLLVCHPDLDEERMKELRVKTWLDFFSPRKAAGVFRTPLYLYRELGIPATTVLKYMKACDYYIFGCIAEDKFYRKDYPAMVEKYFRSAIRSFEDREMDMTEKFDEFTDMLGLKFLKNALDGNDVAVNVTESGKVLASLELKIRAAKIFIAKVRAVPAKPSKSPNSLNFDIPLILLRNFLAATSGRARKISILAAVMYNSFVTGSAFRLIKKIARYSLGFSR